MAFRPRGDGGSVARVEGAGGTEHCRPRRSVRQARAGGRPRPNGCVAVWSLHAKAPRMSNVTAWVAFAVCVLVVAVLYWAQAILVPIALATLLAFLLAPAVDVLERWVGRIASVLLV